MCPTLLASLSLTGPPHTWIDVFVETMQFWDSAGNYWSLPASATAVNWGTNSGCNAPWDCYP